jgi:hypothetical protein
MKTGPSIKTNYGCEEALSYTHKLQHKTVLSEEGNQAEIFYVIKSCVRISNSHQLLSLDIKV